MNTSDFLFIESKLGILLPDIFKRMMVPLPNDATHRLQSDDGSIQTNPEMFVIEYLRRFHPDYAQLDWYEKQPELRKTPFIPIGGDGCGNYYCMRGDDAKTTELWFWEHDPFDGFVRHTTPLDAYLAQGWIYAVQEDPFSESALNGRTVTRSTHPTRAPLEPIHLKEWLDFVGQESKLRLSENHEMINPFTQEKRSFRMWPGRAEIAGGGHIHYAYGALVADRSGHEQLLADLAQTFNAKVL